MLTTSTGATGFKAGAVVSLQMRITPVAPAVHELMHFHTHWVRGLAT